MVKKWILFLFLVVFFNYSLCQVYIKKTDVKTMKFSILKEDDSINSTTKLYTLQQFLVAHKKWMYMKDDYGRSINVLKSPEMKFCDMKEQLGFNDSDLNWFYDESEKKMRAIIVTSWLTLNLYFEEHLQSKVNENSICIGFLTDHSDQRVVDKRNKDRGYNYPSIMEKDDRYGDSLLNGLWIELRDLGWNRLDGPAMISSWKMESPMLSFEELKNQLNFNDDDVVYNEQKDNKEEPDAFVYGAVDRCEIYIVGTSFDLNKSTKVKAFVIDNQVDEYVKQYYEESFFSKCIRLIKTLVTGHPQK